MKKLSILLLVIFSVNILNSNSQNTDKMNVFLPDNPAIRYVGRIDFENTTAPKLISAGSYFTFTFTGTSCNIIIKAELNAGTAFISIECDNEYIGRVKISHDDNKYQVVSGLSDTIHTLKICKATEAITGAIEFNGIECKEIAKNKTVPAHRIEFIGNSITCGAESDSSDYPCNSGGWFDRHNAYLAYGPRLARTLNADWLLSSVSGMGLTRNWNNEGPALPAYYDNLYLTGDSSKKWSGQDYNPELVSICLGTNDNSNGDGSYDRKSLDSTKFVDEYIRFVKHIIQRYPDAMICLLNSPVFDGELRTRFQGYLEKTAETINKETGTTKVHCFAYANKYEHGCNGHPDINEHKEMAEELLPFFKKVTGW